MIQDAEIDSLARRLILGIHDELRAAGLLRHLDRELIGVLYLRTREALAQWGKPPDEGAIDELALTIYLTVSAWQSGGDLPVSILSSLRRHIAGAMPAHKNLPVRNIERSDL